MLRWRPFARRARCGANWQSQLEPVPGSGACGRMENGPLSGGRRSHLPADGDPFVVTEIHVPDRWIRGQRFVDQGAHGKPLLPARRSIPCGFRPIRNPPQQMGRASPPGQRILWLRDPGPSSAGSALHAAMAADAVSGSAFVLQGHMRNNADCRPSADFLPLRNENSPATSRPCRSAVHLQPQHPGFHSVIRNHQSPPFAFSGRDRRRCRARHPLTRTGLVRGARCAQISCQPRHRGPAPPGIVHLSSGHLASGHLALVPSPAMIFAGGDGVI